MARDAAGKTANLATEAADRAVDASKAAANEITRD